MYTNPDVLDAALNHIADNGNYLHLLSANATTYTQAATTYTLGSVALTVGDGNGDYTVGAGSPSGRLLTIASQTVTPTGTGTATHLAIVKSSTTTLLFCGDLPESRDLVTAQAVTVASFTVAAPDIAEAS